MSTAGFSPLPEPSYGATISTRSTAGDLDLEGVYGTQCVVTVERRRNMYTGYERMGR